MKIIIAPDSFKESLSAAEACRFLEKGVRKVFPRAQIVSIPMADGGEGTMLAVAGRSGKIIKAQARGPMGKKVRARYGLIEGGKTAVIEMAEASGLHRVPPAKRNPMLASSFGTGELILKALGRGCTKVLLTLGGVATNDAGAGIAKALGYRFLDKSGRDVPEGAGGFKFLHRIDASRVHPLLRRAQFTAACDVKNPLCGPQGSAAVYGPQKGATPAMVRQIEILLRHFSKIVERDLGISVLKLEGGGAAGGAGAGAVAFLRARLKRGIDTVMEFTRFEERTKGADLILTGEGKIDSQTAYGKTLSGIGRVGKKHRIPVVAFCGTIGEGAEKVRALGISSFFQIADDSVPLKTRIRNVGPLLQKACEDFLRSGVTRNNG